MCMKTAAHVSDLWQVYMLMVCVISQHEGGGAYGHQGAIRTFNLHLLDDHPTVYPYAGLTCSNQHMACQQTTLISI